MSCETRVSGGGLLGEYGYTPGEKLADPVDVADGVIASKNNFMDEEGDAVVGDFVVVVTVGADVVEVTDFVVVALVGAEVVVGDFVVVVVFAAVVTFPVEAE